MVFSTLPKGNTMHIAPEHLDFIIEDSTRPNENGDGINGIDNAVSAFLRELEFYKQLDTARDCILASARSLQTFLLDRIDEMPEPLAKIARAKAERLSGIIHTQYDNVRTLIASMIYGTEKRKGHLVPLIIAYTQQGSKKAKAASDIAKYMAKMKEAFTTAGHPEMYDAMVKAMGSTHDTLLAGQFLAAEQAEQEQEGLDVDLAVIDGTRS